MSPAAQCVHPQDNAKCLQLHMQRMLQEDADNALNMADKATAALEEERAQLTQQNEELLQKLGAYEDAREAESALQGTSAQSSGQDTEVLLTLTSVQSQCF